MSDLTTTLDLRKGHAAGFARPGVHDELSRLLDLNAREAARRQLFRGPRDEERMLLMRRPVSTERAYALLGLMLGLFPPAAILVRIFRYAFPFTGHVNRGLLLLAVAAILTCAAVGGLMGRKLGRGFDEVERAPWNEMLMAAFADGVWWAVVTGGMGGGVFFFIGAPIGVACALPVGALGFALFTLLHRPLTHGGMIEASHLWPLACGVALSIAALILRISNR